MDPRVDFRTFEFELEEGLISIIVIPSARTRPVYFAQNAYIRVGQITRNLHEFPEKEAKIWNKRKSPFEKEIALDGLGAQGVIDLLSTETYFDLMKLPYPQNRDGVIERFMFEKLLKQTELGYAITNLGAILFAKDLRSFEGLVRKSVRVVVYEGQSKVKTIREQTGRKGYAVGFSGLVDWVNGQLPANEIVGKALRTDSRIYPEIAVRELIANSLIHQDFSTRGFPMIEIYSDRIDISNSGSPLVTPDRFIDSYLSRNELLADLMRRLGYCEEKGSGMDKVFFYNELYQLPPLNIGIGNSRTSVSMYSYKELAKLNREERIQACYQHTCLRYVSNERMSNESLRERFDIPSRNAALASRIIKDTVEKGLIKADDPGSKSKKFKSYVPFWA